MNIDRGAIDSAREEAEEKSTKAIGNKSGPQPKKHTDISKAKSLTRQLNIIGGTVGVWALFLPFPYTLVITVCALIPAISIFSMEKFKGHINFETKEKKSKRPSLTFALAIPPAALAWRAVNDFHIFSFNNVWLPVLVVSITFSALIWMYSADMKKNPLYLLISLFIGLMYGYGLVIAMNCLTDRSMPEYYDAKVLDKRISSTSESNSYYIKVTPWGPRTTEEEISIKKKGYDRIRVNDKISIALKEGTLGIPWFLIRLQPEQRPAD